LPRLTIDFLPDYSDEQILAELRRIAVLLGKGTLTKRDVQEHGRVSHSAVVRRFGSLRAALQNAGLKAERFMKPTDDEILDILVELWVRCLESAGRRPQRMIWRDLGIGSPTIRLRVGLVPGVPR
jgi:hypothetical protein